MNKVKHKIKSSISEKERSLINASLGKKPTMAGQEKQLKEIKDIKNKGRIIYVPHD